MAEEGVIGVDVIVKIGTPVTAILGQRNAKMSYPLNLIDMRVKTDFPNYKSVPGWEGPITIDCDGLLMAGGNAGAAGLVNTLKARTLVAIEVTVGDSGEKFEGSAWMNNFTADAPQENESTYTCQLTVDGELTATEGS